MPKIHTSRQKFKIRKVKKYFLLLCIAYIGITAFGQNSIPNGNFENWTSNTFTNPTGWYTLGKITQITPGYTGNYALRVERDPANIVVPGAIVYGIPGNNSVSGGIPFADRPDSLVGFFKYNITTGDSAWILFSFKLHGIPISIDTNFITGSNTSGFKRFAFKVHYLLGLTPDSLIIGITSTNPNKQFTGSYIIVDNLYFTHTALTIPNGDFETWIDHIDEEPNDWYTTNKLYFSNPTLPVTKTTDSYSGNYAIRIENLKMANGLLMVYAFSGPQGNNGPLPGFPVSMRDTTFSAYYKFYPQNNDTLTIGVMMFEMGKQVGFGFFQSKASKSSYTPFTSPIYYNFDYTGTPDSATIFLMAFSAGQLPHGNSVLYVDSFSFNKIIKAIQTITFGTLSTKTLGDPSFDLTATASSELPVTYVSSNTNVATINGKTVTIIGAGTTDITASQAGNENYHPASSVIQTLTVTQRAGIDLVSSEMLKISPNPTTGSLFIQSQISINNIRIYNLLGILINQYRLNSKTGVIDIKQLSNGLYIIKIQCGEKEYLRKIEKE